MTITELPLRNGISNELLDQVNNHKKPRKSQNISGDNKPITEMGENSVRSQSLKMLIRLMQLILLLVQWLNQRMNNFFKLNKSNKIRENYYNFSRVFDKMYSESKLVSLFFLVTFVLENIGNRFRMNVVNFHGLFLQKRITKSNITEF